MAATVTPANAGVHPSEVTGPVGCEGVCRPVRPRRSSNDGWTPAFAGATAG